MVLVLPFNVVDFTLFDTNFDSRSNPFEEIGDDVDQSVNTNDPLHVPNGPITRSKANVLKKTLNGMVVQISAKIELRNPLEHQEEALIHLIHVQEGPNQPLFRPTLPILYKFWLTLFCDVSMCFVDS
jgi:hypothetical protein